VVRRLMPVETISTPFEEAAGVKTWSSKAATSRSRPRTQFVLGDGPQPAAQAARLAGLELLGPPHQGTEDVLGDVGGLQAPAAGSTAGLSLQSLRSLQALQAMRCKAAGPGWLQPCNEATRRRGAGAVSPFPAAL
jgi:hypothetical protein